MILVLLEYYDEHADKGHLPRVVVRAFEDYLQRNKISIKDAYMEVYPFFWESNYAPRTKNTYGTYMRRFLEKLGYGER